MPMICPFGDLKKRKTQTVEQRMAEWLQKVMGVCGYREMA